MAVTSLAELEWACKLNGSGFPTTQSFLWGSRVLCHPGTLMERKPILCFRKHSILALYLVLLLEAERYGIGTFLWQMALGIDKENAIVAA